jgi:hypothetical protein
VLEKAIADADSRGIEDVLLVLVNDFKTAYHRVTIEAIKSLAPALQKRVKVYIRRVGLMFYPHSTNEVLKMMERGCTAEEIIARVHYIEERVMIAVPVTQAAMIKAAVWGRMPAVFKKLKHCPDG